GSPGRPDPRERRGTAAAPPTPTTAGARRGSLGGLRDPRERLVEPPPRRTPHDPAAEPVAAPQPLGGRQLDARGRVALGVEPDRGLGRGEHALERRLLELLPPPDAPRRLERGAGEVGAHGGAARGLEHAGPGKRG